MAKKSILIVDDERIIRSLIVKLVQSIDEDYQIVEAEDGVDGLKRLENQKFDLLITDLFMPKIDGKEMIARMRQQLKKDQQPKQILILSGHLDPNKSYTNKSQISYMAKPYDEGLLKAFVKDSLYNEKAPPVGEKLKLDVDFINPFIEGTLRVLDLTAGIPAYKDKVYIRQEGHLSGDISSIIAMISDEYQGTLAISFEKECYLKVVGSMLGEEQTDIDDENIDAIGELCNQIFGSAKTILNGRGHTLKQAIPTVVLGDGHELQHKHVGTRIAVNFMTQYGDFIIEATVNQAVNFSD